MRHAISCTTASIGDVKLHANRSTASATNITALFARITPLFSGKEEVQ
jgi:hypothetical protein